MNKKNNVLAVFVLGMLAVSQQAMSITTGLNFAGGCVEPADGVPAGSLCDGGSNASEANVAAILGPSGSGCD